MISVHSHASTSILIVVNQLILLHHLSRVEKDATGAAYQDKHDALGPERGPAEEEGGYNNNWI